MNAKLITAQEALQLYEHMKFDEWEDAGEIAATFAKRFEGKRGNMGLLLGCIFHAGRVLGIREERQRNTHQ